MQSQDDIRAQRRQDSDRVVAMLRMGLPAILARHPVNAAYVYGSLTRGVATPFSDVDIALVLQERLPPYDRLMLELAVEGDIEGTLGLPAVDVRAINEAPLVVRGRIVQEGVLLYERERSRRVAFLRRVHREGLLF
jgi:predicted nucleotidyltransferase